VALLSGHAAAFKERRITARCRFSLYSLPSPDAIEVSAASASLVGVERGIYRVRNPSVRHKTPSCASTVWTKYESLCTPSDGTALIAIDVN